ncbi:DUF1049 domain-containing protein [Rhodococcus opacus]|nr:DUF1049 domain-containing protein [Rhodococcus opacus]
MSTSSEDPATAGPPDRLSGCAVPAPGTAASDAAHPGMHPDVARGKGIKHTRTGATWSGLVVGLVVLLVLLVFILQNLDSVTLELFAWEFTVPLGVTLLFAAIAGAVIMALVGGMRILQIRRAANRQRKLTAPS